MGFIFYLQHFADEAAPAGSGTATGGMAPQEGAAGSAPGVVAADAGRETRAAKQELAHPKRKTNPLANVTYGRQPVQQQAAAPVEATDTQGDQQTRPSFDDLIKGDYKADYDERVARTVQERLKGAKAREEQANKILSRLAAEHGMDTSDMSKLDLEALSTALDEDGDRESLEREALEKGLDIETVKKIHRLEKTEAARKAQDQAMAQENMIRDHLNKMIAQEPEMKKMYPGFSLEQELKNPQFVRLTAPNVGVDVRTAYEVVHRDEMRGAEMQYAAERSSQRIAASIQANGKRPQENGMNGSVGAVNKSDPRTLTRADRKEIRERVARGEKIYF